MQPLPSQQLNPKIKAVWRINDAIWIIICYLICMVPCAIIAAAEPGEGWPLLLMAIFTILFVALLILFLVILPPVRYARWRYQLSEDYLDIARGIFWRKRFVIPFIRVSDAAGSHEIPGLDSSEAEALRDKAAELARLAREDV